MNKEMRELYSSLKKELRGITFEYLKNFANDIGIKPHELCRIIGIKTGKHYESLDRGEVDLSRSQKIALYFFDALYEQKPMFLYVAQMRSRSYWRGYIEAGGTPPKDIAKTNLVEDTDTPYSLKDYRRGVLDYAEERNDER